MNLSDWVTPSQLTSVVIVIVATLVARFLIVHAVRRVTARGLNRGGKRQDNPRSRTNQIVDSVLASDDERFGQRVTKLTSAFSRIISINLYVIAVLTILQVFGVPLAPLLTAGAVVGIIIALGAQSLVRDFLSGMFMLMEDQYGAGDVIDTGTVIGTVEEFGLRATRLHDASGTVWYVRNGEIRKLGNQSQGWSRAIVDIPVGDNANPDRVIKILEDVAASAANDPMIASVLVDTPKVIGIVELSPSTMTIRVEADSQPNQHCEVQRWLRRRCLAALAEHGMHAPSSSDLTADD